MAESPKVGSSVLVGVMAFIAASAWAALEILSDASNVPVPIAVSERQAAWFAEPRPVRASELPRDAVAAVGSQDALPDLQPDAPLVAVAAASEPAAPVAKRSVSRPVAAARKPAAPRRAPASREKILVEERKLSRDQRIRMQVMERLSANAHLSGKIGVESKNAVVRLTGRTSTVGQARRAEREARGVAGVRHVRNEIRARVGGSV